MCGIVGSINFPIDGTRVKKVMLHRGPDEQQSVREGNVELYHLRLSILDIEGGKQPMSFENNFTIVFNGEIYNYLELNQKFNLPVKSNSDTETLLHLYKKLGSDFLAHVDGMFALAIHDKEKKELFIARDRAGKKPLYLYNNNGQILFASELNCLNELISPEINKLYIPQYLRLGSFYRGQTPFQHIEELPGGSFVKISTVTTNVSIKRWWKIEDFYGRTDNISSGDALKQVDTHLHKAVERRILSSDLEVGSFLSGGIDSGLVTAIASSYTNSLKTFTVSFDGAYNEAPLARLVAQKYNTNHTEIEISFANLKDDVESILLNYGEPFFDSSAIPSYYVSKAAKEHLTVVLNGDGADELFGGYRRYVPFAKYDWFDLSNGLKGILRLMEKKLPSPKDKKSYYNYIYRLISLANKSGINSYLSATSDIFEGYQDKIQSDQDSFSMLEQDFLKIQDSSFSGLEKILNLDFNTILFSDLLVKMDIATMANSLEGRSPFLSKELLEFAPTLPDDLKIKGSTTKTLLRSLAQKYLPKELINQPKRGFEIPLKSWVENELEEMIFDYLTPKDAFWREFIDPEWMEKVFRFKTDVPAEKRAKMIWTLFSLEVWYQKKIRNR